MKSLSTLSTTLGALVTSLGLVACGGAELEPTDQARSASLTRPSAEPAASAAFAEPATSAVAVDHRAKNGRGRGPRNPEKLIERFDTNKNGTLEVAELPERMQQHIADIDTSKDNVVTKAELSAHFQTKKALHGKRLFERKDVNKDGVLDTGEVKSEHWARLVVADANGDQKLTQDELKAAIEAGKIERPKHGKRHDRNDPAK